MARSVVINYYWGFKPGLWAPNLKTHLWSPNLKDPPHSKVDTLMCFFNESESDRTGQLPEKGQLDDNTTPDKGIAVSPFSSRYESDMQILISLLCRVSS